MRGSSIIDVDEDEQIEPYISISYRLPEWMILNFEYGPRALPGYGGGSSCTIRGVTVACGGKFGSLYSKIHNLSIKSKRQPFWAVDGIVLSAPWVVQASTN